MEKLIMLFFLFIMSFNLLFPQESSPTSTPNLRLEGIYIIYNNLIESENNSKLLGGGILLYNETQSAYFDAEFSFTIGKNQIEMKNPYAQINLGFPIIYLTKNLKRNLFTEISGGFGISTFSKNDDLRKNQSYMGFQPFIGLNLNFWGIFLRTKFGPIFSTSVNNFHSGSLQIGYLFYF